MRGFNGIPHGLSRVPAILFLLPMLCDCAPRGALNRAVEQEASDRPYILKDPLEYAVDGYGTIRFHKKTLPPCPFDTIATVVTDQCASHERAMRALLDMVTRYKGTAVIRFKEDTLVIRSTDAPRTVEVVRGEEMRDANGRVIGRTPNRAVLASPGERSLRLKYQCHGTVVRYRDGGCRARS